MKKPYIICHMACSIDGKIVFENWGDDIPKDKYSALYNECHEAYGSQGWILGRVSLEKDFSKGLKPELTTPDTPIERKRRRLVLDEIDAEDFRIIKNECREEVRMLADKLTELPAKAQNMKTLDILLERVVTKFLNIQQRYCKAEPQEKRKIVASLYPDFVTFNGEQHRTPRPNEVLQVILLVNSALESTKKGKNLF